MKTQLTIMRISLIIITFMLAGQSPALIDENSIAGIWLLDEGTGKVVADSSENGNAGEIIGEPKWVAGKFGKALEFDGTDDMVDTSYSSDEQNSGFTILAWIKPTVAISTQIVVVGRSNGGPQLNLNSGGKAMTGFKMDNGQFAHISGTTIFSKGKWTHIAGTYDGSVIKVYVDGVEEGTLKPTNPPGKNSYTVQIGAFDERLHGGGYVGQFAPAAIDEVAVFNVALTKDEIKAIINQGLYGAAFAVSYSGKLTSTWGKLRKKSMNAAKE
jgi:hypothetical protein